MVNSELKNIKKENIIFFTQLPPPYAGPEIMTQGFIDYLKKNNFNIIVIKSNIQSSNFQFEERSRLNF